jgi:hypothetical protein
MVPHRDDPRSSTPFDAGGGTRCHVVADEAEVVAGEAIDAP